MKALLIADDENVIEKISETLKHDGFDVIIYKWLLKALDNIEEISPEVIIIQAASYPRHWKTLVQFAKSEITGFTPKIILFAEREFSEDDIRKSEVLGVNGIFNSIDENGLKEFSSILIGKKSEKKLLENFDFIFTNPRTDAFVTGKVENYLNNKILFLPDFSNYVESLNADDEIKYATLKSKNTINFVRGKILKIEKKQNEKNNSCKTLIELEVI